MKSGLETHKMLSPGGLFKDSTARVYFRESSVLDKKVKPVSRMFYIKKAIVDSSYPSRYSL